MRHNGILPYEIEVEYNHLVTGLEWSTHIEAPALDNPVSLLDINAGIRYRISPHWLWQTGAFFQFKIDPAQAGIPRYWGIKSVMCCTSFDGKLQFHRKLGQDSQTDESVH
jgi:hypothetical protein